MFAFGELILIVAIGGMAFGPQPARWIATSLVGTTTPVVATLMLGTRSSIHVTTAPAAVIAPPPPARP